MQGTDSAASAAATAAGSSSLGIEAASSNLERKPTWTELTFDDGFDLNLDKAAPALAAASTQNAASSASSPIGPSASSSAQPSRQLAQDTASTSASVLPSTTFPNSTDAAPIERENKRASASPVSPNKALPQLPPNSSSMLDSTPTLSSDRRQPSNESQSGTVLPGSASYASTIHARGTSSQDGAPTPQPPGSPQAISPIVSAASPKQQQQPQHSDPDTTPIVNSTRHQPSRSQSSDVLGWDRPQVRHPRPVSSADAYMPIETLQSDPSSRPGTAMSHLSGSNWMHERGPSNSNRSSVGTSSTLPMNQAKRGSVLSFQTANSAGFTSGDEHRASDYEDLADDTFMPAAQSNPNLIRPWLAQDSNGYASSPDERFVPGGMPGSFWDQPAPQLPPRDMPPVRPPKESQPTLAPAASVTSVPTTPTAASSEPTAARSASTDATVSDASAQKDDIRDTRGAAAGPEKFTESMLAPIHTQGLAPSSSNTGPLSSTTIVAPSDETTLAAMRRSPEISLSRRAPSPLPPTEAEAEAPAPPPPAKDVRVVQPAAPSPAFSEMPPRNDATHVPATEPSPPPADNVIPPPLPSEAVRAQPAIAADMLMNGPVSDYRKKPLANISPAQKAAGLAHLQAQARAPQQQQQQPTMEMQALPPPMNPPPAEAPPIAVMERARRKSNASLTANVALAQAGATTAYPRNDAVETQDPSSTDSESQESSAPPDGEVEARAEWERRRRMKRKNSKRQNDSTKSQQKGRSDTFKNQLKPLQLVPADNLNSFMMDRSGLSNSNVNMAGRGAGDRSSVAMVNRISNSSAPTLNEPPATAQTYSTSQLQKLQAREQRRSVGAFSAAMAAANVVSSGSNGPYPVFASPNSGPQKVGGRQYPGLMAQRSLVPPFELQHRPDGLPSGMIGPDGIRRSLNDPEVCLECMMRDEDMIDIRVVGDGIWERESDKEFEEAVRLEAEEVANGNGFRASGSNGHSESISSHRDSRGSRQSRKKIGKGEPLTVERLKLHTQMNPPASSFRWRTLQTFLAIQAKYIAMEQQRLRQEVEKKTRYNNDSISSRGSIIGLDAPLPGQAPERNLSSPFAPSRDVSSRQSMLQTTAEDSGLTLSQKQEKERDIAAAQAARKKLTASSAAEPLGLPVYPTTPLQVRSPPQALPPVRAGSDPDDLVATAAAASPTSSRRAPFSSAQAARAASVQDLRSAAEAARSGSAGAGYPPSPADSLMPPSRSFMGGISPTGTPSRAAGRSGASQLSLMHSGSMIDMHVGQENQIEHKLNQNGFLPGTPLAVESPSAMNRSFYGFPGDGDSSLPDAAAFERSRMVSGDGYVNPMEAGPRGLDPEVEDGSKRTKKKGFRGLFSKLTGNNSNGPSRESSYGPAVGGSINGSIASRNASKRSQNSGTGSPRMRKNSISADRSLDAASPGLNGMLSKARKSTSSFFKNGVEPDTPRPLVAPQNTNSLFQNPPGMASQNSLDLGPFQPASPQGNNAFLGNSSVNGRAGSNLQDQQRMRKASNPLMQKYLNSPSPRTQASSPISSPIQASSPAEAQRNGNRISSYASMRDLRPSALQTIPDGDGHADETDVPKAGLRKELPTMPAPAIESGRKSMQTSRIVPPTINTSVDTAYGADDVSIGSAGPLRPPKNPRRPDGGSSIHSPSVVDLGNGGREMFPPQQTQSRIVSDVGSVESKKSRFLRLPFGRKKRDSTLSPSILVDGTPPTEMRSTSSSFFPTSLRSRKSYSALGNNAPKSSFQLERQRVLSSPARDSISSPRDTFAPRSQSAFGMAPTNRFMSMDIPRRSINPSRNRLSTMEYEEEEDEDDEMGREPGYEAEFERYAREAQQDTMGGGRGGGGVGGGGGFGRKSLNLLREGFRMPLRQASGSKR